MESGKINGKYNNLNVACVSGVRNAIPTRFRSLSAGSSRRTIETCRRGLRNYLLRFHLVGNIALNINVINMAIGFGVLEFTDLFVHSSLQISHSGKMTRAPSNKSDIDGTAENTQFWLHSAVVLG